MGCVPPRSLYPTFDRMLDGKLGDILRDLHDSGLKWPAVAEHMRVEHGIEADPDTFRRWFLEPPEGF